MPVQRPGINDPTRQNNYQPFNSQTLQNLVQKLRDAMSNGSMQYGQPNNDQSGFIQPMPLVPGGTPPTGMAPALTGALPNQMPQNNISQAADSQFRMQDAGRGGQNMQPYTGQAYAPRTNQFQSQSARQPMGGWGGPFAGAMFSVPPGAAPGTLMHPANQLAIQWLAALAKSRQQQGAVATRYGFMNPVY
jgi:hypothetical protein